MSQNENIAVVQQAYAAFQRADIAGVLELLASDVEWDAVRGVPANVPIGGRRRGREQVAEFFATLGREQEFQRFEPREFLAQGERVVALGSYEARVNRTGRSFSGDWAMAFKVRNGKIVEFTEFADSYGIAAAY
jgi:ketosteroid isomerase-like protein